jgi:hypothetical protein
MWDGSVYGNAKNFSFYVWPVRGALNSYSISGNVIGDVQAGITLTLSGDNSATTTTDSSGNYSFTDLSNGTYTITPEKSGYTFTPSSRMVIINGANQTGIDFTATFNCTYNISPTNQSISSAVGTGSVSVTTQSGCSWTATSNDSWITITSGSSGTGNGTVNYSVSSNANTNSRTGTMTIAGQTFTITQSGLTCTYTISPTKESFDSSGGTRSVSVTTQSGCAWTATSNASWISIISGSTGTGNGTVNYTVSANTTPNQRTGTMTIAGQTFTIMQQGITCSYTISPKNQSFDSSGGTGNISVTTQSGCSWTATSNSSWITISSGNSGTGNGTVSYSVSANTSQGSRTGTMTIAGGTCTITQEGKCSTWDDVINAYQQYVNSPCQ